MNTIKSIRDYPKWGTTALILLIIVRVSFAQNISVQTGVVVLKDGRVFEGTIRQVAGGYRVDHERGYTILPFDEVHITAESLVAAYEAMRDATVKPSTEQHLTLAEWCLDHGLLKQARLEVTWALKLEPLRIEARLMLARIDAETKQPAKSKPKPAMTADGFRQPEARNQAELSRESHQEYIRRIQPILMNKCANAGCHGSAGKSDFTLTMVRSRSQNINASQDNLEAVLKFVQAGRPLASPLLSKPNETTHHHNRLFAGTAGQQQYKVLQLWVQNVAAAGQASQPIESTPISKTPQKTASPIPTRKGNSKISQTSGETSPPSNTKALLQEVRAAQQPDAFDPEVFNRMMHGASAAELKAKGQQ